MSFHSPIVYTPSPALLRAWEARGYPSLAIQWHLEAQDRKKRMEGRAPKDAPRTVRIVIPSPYKPDVLASWITKETYREAHDILDQIDGIVEIELTRLPRPKLILSLICEEFGVLPSDVLSDRRTANLVLPRQICMWMNKQLRPDSLPAIGRNMGDRDHTTILHGIRKIQHRVDSDPTFKRQLENIRRIIEVRAI